MLMNLQEENKQIIRNKIKAIRQSMTKQEKDKLDLSIFKHAISCREYRQSSEIFTYVSMRHEVSTVNLIKKAFEDNKRVAVPKCNDENGNMDFYYINSLSELEKGFFGIMEPKTHKCEKVTKCHFELIIVPGMAFDLNGYRIGYGRGYYDRLFTRCSGYALGLCYENSVFSMIEHEHFDKSVNMLITEKRILRL